MNLLLRCILRFLNLRQSSRAFYVMSLMQECRGTKKAHRYEDSFAVYVLDKVRYLSNKVRSSAEIASVLNTGVLIFSKNSDIVI